MVGGVSKTQADHQRRRQPKYVLDATKERLEQAPPVEGENLGRLYARETAKPVVVY